MTHQNNTGTLDGLPRQTPFKIGSPRTILARQMPRLGLGIGHSNSGGRLFSGVGASVVFLLCVMLSAASPANGALFTQAPNVDSPDRVADGASASLPPRPNLPSDVEFDIDLGTEEFENFGEEDFLVEEENYFRDTVVPIAIKVTIGAVVILLLAWVAMKLVKPQRPTSSE